MTTATRPLSGTACSAADNDLYAAHAGDPRPNALFDIDGNRKPLDPDDPSQADLRAEWMVLYEKHGGEVEEPNEQPETEPDDPVEHCPYASNVVVAINLAQPIACPGQPLAITAVGTPGGGTYRWTISGGQAELVDAVGNVVSTGATVNLRGFKPDDATGNIPEQTITVTVDYTHPNGVASDTVDVKIHKIDFVVTNDRIVFANPLEVDDRGADVLIGNPAPATMPALLVNAEVEIQLDPACPAKTTCAQNHEVGWLQTVIANQREARYSDTLAEQTIPIPIRDELKTNINRPFYDHTMTFVFGADRDLARPGLLDRPNFFMPHTDPRTGTPGALRRMMLSNDFHVWLAVRNKAWWDHDEQNSLLFLRNFTWHCDLTADIDPTKPIGSRCTIVSRDTKPDRYGAGKGGVSPELDPPAAHNSQTFPDNPAPHIP